ncbi:hypothetical protein B7463_g9874, partial [Scytalidium lignicola]
MLLSRWAGSGGDVITAQFFFWNNGTPEQLIPAVFLERWLRFGDAVHHNLIDFEGFNEAERRNSWTLPQIVEAFQRLLRENVGYVCLFIDGLDEYVGDPMETVRLLKHFVSSKVKICLSSHPWLVFEDSFKECAKLKPQDFTFSDIETYVKDKLGDDERMARLYTVEPIEAPKLIHEIVTKADSVFIWVKLVVQSLLRGLMNRDQIKNLQRRLRLLPIELESLFGLMMEQIEAVYAEEGPQIFLIILKYSTISKNPLSAIELSFALESDPDLAFSVL